MSGTPLAFSLVGGLARIALNAPSRRNAIGMEFCSRFAEIAKSCAANPEVRVVLLEARGEFLSVGGDLAEFVAHRSEIERHVGQMATLFHEGILALWRARAPLVVALGGTAAGGGFSLVCGADVVVAKRSVRLVSAYTKSGLTPDGGGTWFLTRLVGRMRAFEIMALNPVLTADEAKALGLVSTVVEDDIFDATVDEVTNRLLSCPADTLFALKELLHHASVNTLEQQLEREGRSIASLAARDSTLALLDAFLSKRT